MIWLDEKTVKTDWFFMSKTLRFVPLYHQQRFSAATSQLFLIFPHYIQR
jgi:hypothetical protein